MKRGWTGIYVLLGMVIEQGTGRPITEVFEERLFGPLGMADTTFPTDTTAMDDPYLSGLTEQGQPTGQTVDATGWSPSEAFTAGEVVSTFSDLQRWAEALFTGEGILSPASQELRRDSIIYGIPPADSPTSGYGIGIGDRDGWWGHDGQIPGTRRWSCTTTSSTPRSSCWSTATSPSAATPARRRPPRWAPACRRS
jgi:D-alanyl-D-alanine carboxypeptidase